MRTAVIVVSTPEVLEDAVEWATAGLVADSLWLSADEANSIDRDAPNALRAVPLRPGLVGEPVRLAESLSELGPQDEIRVAWIRPPDAGISTAMKDLEGLLRELVPPDQTCWLDIVVPQKRTDAALVPLPGQWVQVRIVPEDRSAPDVVDAGWDLQLDVPLHTALLAVGILGGTQEDLPWGVKNAAKHYEIRGFSRVVLGAGDVGHFTDRFIGQEVPASSAGTVGFYPKEYVQLRGAEAGGFAAEAVDYLLKQESGALGYRDPASSTLVPPPNLTFWQHLVLYFRFLGFGILLLLGKKIVPVKVAYSKYDFLDAGYNIDKTGPSRGPKVRIPDFDALDAEAAEQAWKELSDLNRTLSHSPPKVSPTIWRLMTRLATSINDGGIRPDGWNPVDRNERKPVLAAPDVQPTPPRPVITEIVELEAARNPAVAAAAVADAGVPRNRSLAPLDERSVVVSTAQALIDEGNREDMRRLDAQLEEIAVETDEPARSLLDRLAARVCGATLRSRLDAERWTELATEPSAADPLDWSGATRKFRKRSLIGSIVCAVLAIAWAIASFFLRDDLPTWLSTALGLIVVAAVFVGFLLWSVYAFFQVYNAFLERGRRRLEIRRLWFDRASAAIVQNARLRAAGPAFDRWLDLLAAVYPRDDEVGSPVERVMPADAPKGIAVSVPVFDDREITEWLRDEAAAPGWRSRALDEMVAASQGVPTAEAMKILVEDDGLPGGPLFDTCGQRAALWAKYTQDLRDSVSIDVAGHFVDSPDRELRILTPAHRRETPVLYSEFSQEPWPPVDEDDERWSEELDFPVRDRLGRGRPGTVGLAADVCALAMRIQFRDLGTDESSSSRTDGESVDPEDY